MDIRVISTLITKTSGLILVVYALAMFPNLFATFSFQTDQTFMLMLGAIIVPSIVPAGIGLLLFFRPKTITNAVLGKDVLEDQYHEIQAILFATVGLYLITTALLDLIYYGLLAHYISETDVGIMNDAAYTADIITLAIQLFIGFIVALGAKGLSSLLYKFRYGF